MVEGWEEPPVESPSKTKPAWNPKKAPEDEPKEALLKRILAGMADPKNTLVEVAQQFQRELLGDVQHDEKKALSAAFMAKLP